MPDGKCISATSQCCARERRRCWSACRRPSAVSSTDCSTSWALTCRTGPRRRNYSGHRMGERSATQFAATDVRSVTSIADLVAACKGAMPLGLVRAGFRDDPINGVATVLVGSCLRALRVECQLYTLLARKRPFRIRPTALQRRGSQSLTLLQANSGLHSRLSQPCCAHLRRSAEVGRVSKTDIRSVGAVDHHGEGFRMPARRDLSARAEGRRPKPFTEAVIPSGICLVHQLSSPFR